MEAELSRGALHADDLESQEEKLGRVNMQVGFSDGRWQRLLHSQPGMTARQLADGDISLRRSTVDEDRQVGTEYGTLPKQLR
jgi:hypothetical protein